MAERTLNAFIEVLIKNRIALNERSIKRKIESKYKKVQNDLFLYFDSAIKTT